MTLCQLATSLGFHWAFTPWLAIPALFGAAALAWWLYKMQRRVASRGVVAILTSLRIGLITLVALLLASPVYSWRHRLHTAGTLYVLIDVSGSMQTSDSQAGELEKARLASALGLLPPSLELARLNGTAVRLRLVLDDMRQVQSRLPIDTSLATQAVASSRAGWLAAAQASSALISSASLPNGQRETIIHTARQLETTLEQVKPESLEGAARQLTAFVSDLERLADQADTSVLEKHATASAYLEAIRRVQGMSRLDLAKACLTAEAGDRKILSKLDFEVIRYIAFSDEASPVAVSDEKPALATLAPGGHSTNLDAALHWVLQQVRPGEQSAVLVLSDGRQNLGQNAAETARLLGAQDIRVFTVGVGSARLVPDAAIDRVDSPPWIYKDDTLHARATLRLDGLVGTPLNIGLERDGKTVASQAVTPSAEHEVRTVQLDDKPPSPGLFDYEWRIMPAQGERVTQNNTSSFRLSVRQEKMNILLVDEQPRWEFRYLASVLGRDRRVKLQQVLLQPAQVEQVERPAAVRASPQNASVSADLLPATQAEWDAFDVVVLGDVPPEALDAQQEARLAQAVKNRGTTLALVAGPFNMPQRYLRSRASGGESEPATLSDLLPVHPDAAWDSTELARQQHDGFQPRVTPAGRQQIFTDLLAGLPSAQPPQLPLFFWHALQTRAKPGANVYWTIGASPTSQLADKADDDTRSLLCVNSFGAGKVLYLATDQSWRLRQVDGMDLHERFWGQVVGWAAGDDLPAGGEFARFGSDHPTYLRGQPIQLSAKLLDPQTRQVVAGQTDLKIVARQSGKVAAEVPLKEELNSPGNYRAQMIGLPPGAAELSLEGSIVPSLLAKSAPPLRATLPVHMLDQADLEQQNVNVDFALLGQVASAGGGFYAPLADAALLAEKLPRLSQETEEVGQVGLFLNPAERLSRTSHGVFLSLFVVLISLEWIIRKRAGLV